MDLVNLDDVTREHMRAEAERDLAEGTIYLSDRLTATGAAEWPDLLLEAIDAGNADRLTATLNRNGRLNSHEIYIRKGVARSRSVPVTAAETLAEGEYNRFYIRGVCARALAEGAEIEVYRAKSVMRPRPESAARIGVRLDPSALLEDLRAHTHIDSALGVPSGPNSGLSIRLVTS
jgi:hypothetical protein